MSEKSAIPTPRSLEPTACCGDDCCGGTKATSQTAVVLEPLPRASSSPKAGAHETLAAGTDPRGVVREKYAAVAEGGSCGCGCCGAEAHDEAALAALGYTAEQRSAIPDGADLGLGCGNPLAHAALQAGETVLDLGSGAGFDAFLAGRAVGPSGRVIGVDMTAEMVHAARGNLAKSGCTNVEFRLGEIEHLPVADATVDVILSNCVINLSPEKPAVFREAFRVLKPGGRLAISDIVALRPVPADARADLDLHAGCVAGAATIAELTEMIAAAGFEEVRIAPKQELQSVVDGWFPGRGIAGMVASATITAQKPSRSR